MPCPRSTLRRSFTGSRFLAASLAVVAGASTVFAERLVTVRATADAAYAARRAAQNPPKPETYVFAKGEYFAGVTYDSTLNKMPFEKIVQTLAFDLQKQNYQPTLSLATADLVIVVHWGVTMGNDRGGSAAGMSFSLDALREAAEGLDNMRLDVEAGGFEDLGATAAAVTDFNRTAQNVGMEFGGDDLRSSSNAELLGMKVSLDQERDKLFESETERTVRAMIDEERYFIIMIAYDGAKIREGKKRKLWTSRLSIRAAGVNFKIALDRMSNAGARFHGTKQPDLAMEFIKDRAGTVKVGELKVLQ